VYNHLRLAGDPTVWTLSEPISDPSQLESGLPLQFAVASPVPGTLLLSGKAAASVALYAQEPGGVIPSGGGLLPQGVIPSGDTPRESYLYLPSATGLTADSLGYELPGQVSLADLASQIMSAMGQGTFCTVPLSGGVADGVLAINGATVPFTVLFTVQPPD
jgi:hypothetical protein